MSGGLQRYNLALLPEDAFAAMCVGYAQQFQAESRGYLLGDGALTHMTLSQFDAPESEIEKIWQEAAQACGRMILPVSFNGIYFHAGKERHAGYIWTGFAAVRDPALIALQQAACGALTKRGGKPLTETGEAYFPHVTGARLAPSKTLPAAAWPDAVFGRTHDFHLSLGLSDENGVYLKRLHPVSLEGGLHV